MGGPLHLSQFPLALQHLTSLPLFYYFGYISAKKQRLTKLQELPSWVTFFVATGVLVYFVYYWHYEGHFTQKLGFHTFLRYGNGLAMILLLLKLIRWIQGRLLARHIAFLGQQSLYIYLFHTYLLGMMVMGFKALGRLPSPFLGLFLFFAITLYLNLVIAILVKKIPILDKMCTGRLLKNKQQHSRQNSL